MQLLYTAILHSWHSHSTYFTPTFFPQTLLLPEHTAFAEQAPAQPISLIHSHFLPRLPLLHTIQTHTELGHSRSHYRDCWHFWGEKPITHVSSVQQAANRRQSSCLQPTAAVIACNQPMAGCCSPPPISKHPVKSSTTTKTAESRLHTDRLQECSVLPQNCIWLDRCLHSHL